MALNGKIDRRTKDKNDLAFSSVILLAASIAIAIKSREFFSEDQKLFPLYLGMLIFLIGFCYLYMNYEKKRNSRTEEEYGSSKLLTAKDLPEFKRNFFYDPDIVAKHKKKVKTRYDYNQLKRVCKWLPRSKKIEKDCFLHSQVCGQDVYLSMNTKFLNRNLNTITIGGSGQGKSYSELFPNALMGNGNYVFTDPSGEILLKIGHFLEDVKGYKIKVFNVDEFDKSLKYNPLLYAKTEKDINILVDALNKNIKSGKKQGNSNEFFDDAKDSLMCALIALIKELYPIEGDMDEKVREENKKKQTLKNVMRLLLMAEQEVLKDKLGREIGTTSTLDLIFDRLYEHNPRSYAAASWKSFKIGGPRVCNEVIISACAVFSRYFNTDELEWLTSEDELNLEELASDKPCALFIVTPSSDTSYNFMVSMIYTQLFSIVTKAGKENAERNNKSDPMLPRHLSFWLDEFANTGKIPQFLELLSVVRKYNISINILVQALSQLKGMYKDNWETIIGNIDTMIYLGGQEPSTIKTLSEKLGKETIRTHNYTYNNRSGDSHGIQNLGRCLLEPNEIEQMVRSHELVFITGCKPIQTRKYDLKSHPNYKYSGEYAAYNNYEIKKLYKNAKIDYKQLDAAAITIDSIKEYKFT